MRTLLLLLYGTGLRIGEALPLTLADFDTGTGVLTIRAWLGHVSIDTTNIYAEVDLQRKAEVLAHSNNFSTTSATDNKPWKDDPSLLAFLRSL